MSKSPLNLWVFRDGKRRVAAEQLKSTVTAALHSPLACACDERTLAVLLRAGELECALADEDITAAKPFAFLTDALAQAVVGERPGADFERARATALAASVPGQVTVSTPEGFSYYALHPLAYAKVLDQLPELSHRIFVVGIRSIGCTLSAVTAAAARERGIQAERITVRPTGHPYDRHLDFSPEQQTAIRAAVLAGADFLIVDEGPGLSGSSFLCVAEGLEQMGADRQKITLICSRYCDPDTLCARDAGERWRRFHLITVNPHRPAILDSALFMGGGCWRAHSYSDESLWPASWTNLERSKYLVLSADGASQLLKFGGLGHYGESALQIEEQIAQAGFGVRPTQAEGGFFSYPWIAGRPMQAGDLSGDVLRKLADYCAFRQKCFSRDAGDLGQLPEMVAHNLSELGIDAAIGLKLEYPVIADGRMQPHEWILNDRGEMLKTDSSSHGDDHFFPGPTDIAWDLAGAIVEWRMDAAQTAEFLELYHRVSGDDPNGRIEHFIRAYAVFRWAFCRMAAGAMAGTTEQLRLEAAAESYAAALPMAHVASGV
jgi:hypothetical protein